MRTASYNVQERTPEVRKRRGRLCEARGHELPQVSRWRSFIGRTMNEGVSV